MAAASASALTSSERLARELFLSSLSGQQARALVRVAREARNGGRTMTAVTRELVEARLASEPSARRLLQRLRALGLVHCGSSGSKGTPLSLTPLGEKILEVD